MQSHTQQRFPKAVRALQWVRRWRWPQRALLLGLLPWAVFLWLDVLWPLPLDSLESRRFAQVVVDRQGRPLRAFADDAGVWRYPVQPEVVSPLYIEALLNYEDRHFYRHFGVNPLALMRALWQRVEHGRFVSGASTLTMQVARILEPHEKSLGGKLRQMFRALQLERRFSKQEILALYLNYAPFGGPIEGIEAASHTYLGKSAARLSHSEAALLAVLPQAPSRYRPDRHAAAARAARDKVIERMGQLGVWSPTDVAEALQEPVWAHYRPRPQHAPLLARRLMQAHPRQHLIHSTIDVALQSELEWMLKDHIQGHDSATSAAILVVDNRDLGALAYLGSADFLSTPRSGYVDMVQAVRSPGSTLKPFLYGLAIERGLVHAQSLLFDVPQSFNGYRPVNFDDDFHGPVSLSGALSRSLNMPAVQVLDRLGPQRFYTELINAGLDVRLPSGARPNLSLALGGGGVRLEHLVSLYTALGRGGRTGRVRYSQAQPARDWPLFSAGAAWIVQDILTEAPLDERARSRSLQRRAPMAFKTGTSYGHRDAWALASNQRITVGVWVGRPDGSPLPANSGRASAVPLLRKVLALMPAEYNAPPQRPDSVQSAVICWPLGTHRSAQRAEDCHRRRSAWLLDGVAPPTFSDPLNKQFASRQLNVWLDRDSGARVTPGCHDGHREQRKITVWPLVLDAWLPLPWRREALLPAYDPACVQALSDHALRIDGVHDGADIYPEAGQTRLPAVQLQVQGGDADTRWFVNGDLQADRGRAIALENLAPGAYRVTAMDAATNRADVQFRVHAR